MDKNTIIITGSGGGIGSQLIKYFPKNSRIFAIYNKNKPKKIPGIKLIKMDLKNVIKTKSKITKVLKTNDKIIFLNLASIKNDKISYKITKNEIQESFEVNSFSFFLIIQTILPYMLRKKWGRIINFSSTGGLKGDQGTLLYTASKYSTLGMIEVLSREYAKFNITFNTLKLGNFNTGMYKRLDNKIRKRILKKIPSGKTGSIINIYNGIKFILSSDYVNGSTISIDGGYK